MVKCLNCENTLFVKCSEYQGANTALLPTGVQNYLMCVRCLEVYKLVREIWEDEEDKLILIYSRKKEEKQ
jgi:hypothetical protein